MESGFLAFVIQKHKATALHCDFRLQIGDSMPSWAIPKGPSLDPAVRRLAMPTGPHDLEYRHFEGVIPAGGYGAGPVMIWDQGTYTPELEVTRGVRRKAVDPEEAQELADAGLRDGNLKFTLYGTKLQGSFALVRTKGLGGSKEAWLLIKHRDSFCKAGYEANSYDKSAESGFTMAQISAGAEPGPKPQRQL